jgi:hypothetical protein
MVLALLLGGLSLSVTALILAWRVVSRKVGRGTVRHIQTS